MDNAIMKSTDSSFQDPSRWLMLALVWLLYFCFGMVFRASSPLVTPMLRDLNMSYAQMGIVLGSWQLTYVVFAMVAGLMIDKWGVRKSLFLGIGAIGFSAALRYFATGFTTLLPAVALFGIGGPMISIGAPKTVSVWFKGKDRGMAVGLYLTAPWIGGIIGLSATNTVIMPLTGYSWRWTFVVYGALTFIIAALWMFLAKDHPSEESKQATSIKQVFLNLMSLRHVRVILICGLLSFGIIHGLTNWLPNYMETRGLSPAIAGYVSSLPLVSGIAAVLVIPRMVSPHSRAAVIALLAILAAAGVLVIVMAPPLYLFPGLMLFGGAGSSIFPLLTLMLMETPEVGSKYMGVAGGIFFCVAEIGGFMGPTLLGILVELSGTFLIGALFFAGFYVSIATMMLKLRTIMLALSSSTYG